MTPHCRRYAIKAPDGVHLRPAQLLVEAASTYPDVEAKFIRDDMEADLSSILSVLALGLDQGQEVTLEVRGPGADACLAQIEKVLKQEALI